MTCTSTQTVLWQELGKGLALNLEALHCFCIGIGATLFTTTLILMINL